MACSKKKIINSATFVNGRTFNVIFLYSFVIKRYTNVTKEFIFTN